LQSNLKSHKDKSKRPTRINHNSRNFRLSVLKRQNRNLFGFQEVVCFASAVTRRSDKEMTTSPRSDDNGRVASFIQTVADDSCNKQLTGIAIGVVVNGQESSAFSGWADLESKRPVSESTIFEIGSLTKLFTSLLLAVAATKHEVNLDDPVQTALGDQVTLPTDGTSEITYRSLANHRSSLPRLPDDLIATADRENPYAHYDKAMLYACLSRMKSVKPIGSRSSYSNFGVGLLGHALGKLAGSDYPTALKERVLIPLGMLKTSTGASDEQTAQLATAHKKKNEATKHWDFTEVTVAAGGIRSSLSDMLKFLRANVYPAESAMADELAIMRQPSKLPECEGSGGKYTIWFMAIAYVVFLAIFMVFMFGKQWLTRIGPDGLLHFSFMLLPTLLAAIRWGRIAGAVSLVLMTLLTWWLWGPTPAWSWELTWGAMLIYFFSGWNRSRFAQLLRGDGRLAWQSSAVGTHPMLWHNGMVGGSASYLGIVPEFEIGVVVLTNTAKSVDAIGVKILREMVNARS
jgi:CubicO group peptidase (beta-lactamase class C family)